MTGASLPPSDLPGLDPIVVSHSHLTDAFGTARGWHVLDTAPEHPVGTVLCVHGNPTWSYTFRSVIAELSSQWRVIAPDQLEMGFSERSDVHRTLANRVQELGNLTDALDLTGPVVVVAHDWGGAIALGWAEQHRDLVTGVVLLDTASEPARRRTGPPLIRGARSRGPARTVTERRVLSSTERFAWRIRHCRETLRLLTVRPITVFRDDAVSQTSWPTSRSSLTTRATARLSRSLTTCRRCKASQRCFFGAPATRCSPAATCETSSDECRTPKRIGSREQVTSSSRTLQLPRQFIAS